jgi:ribosomal protein L34E
MTIKRFKRIVPSKMKVEDLSPLNISCGSTKCESGLHCFTRYQNTALKKFGQTSVCYQCGAALESWDRLHKRNIDDALFTFNELKNELIRHVYWHMPIKKDDRNKATTDGIEKINDFAVDRLTTVIGVKSPWRDGVTPYYGNIVYYGQHATACCCRVCMEYWHGIPKGRVLTKKEIDYLSKLIMHYVIERVPELNK